jgi:hypothetical protein
MRACVGARACDSCVFDASNTPAYHSATSWRVLPVATTVYTVLLRYIVPLCLLRCSAAVLHCTTHQGMHGVRRLVVDVLHGSSLEGAARVVEKADHSVLVVGAVQMMMMMMVPSGAMAFPIPDPAPDPPAPRAMAAAPAAACCFSCCCFSCCCFSCCCAGGIGKDGVVACASALSLGRGPVIAHASPDVLRDQSRG